LRREANSLLVYRIDDLRDSIRHVKATWRFRIDAMVVLPEHLHAIWPLPPGDKDSQFRAEEKKVARAVIEGLILEHASQRFANIDDSR